MHSLSLKMLDFATNLQNMRFAIPVKFTRAKNNYSPNPRHNTIHPASPDAAGTARYP
jgi:hypothetical protein